MGLLGERFHLYLPFGARVSRFRLLLLDLPPLFRSPSARFAPIPAIVVRHEEQAGRGSGAEIDPWRRGGCGRGGSPLVARSGESLVRQAAA